MYDGSSPEVICPVQSSITANSILKQWISGNFNNIKQLSLKLRARTITGRVPLAREIVLEGIQTVELPCIKYFKPDQTMEEEPMELIRMVYEEFITPQRSMWNIENELNESSDWDGRRQNLE
ncbi:hypothetical protein CAEBREN_21799 [Caenorhabditis brenneri]|uniref:Uncharacterized protein n=1 Tax=Caenorhabditis brenneri TaxID=135651 RepID=G0PA85_CAEBE|nr:hypothetical protein CAEBREN_21799 [Caenorhabditis brenneri]